ncbi:MAG: TetR family transcriptional regulator C-terminal domain-containing protein [Burkholderiales bacterium]|jgi:TetR/AcrR family transcriptional repressor of nem operon|nr:TetR family transcriptional regulator C-terminal domain-containing protein [Burkholderiales bacterium]
MPKPSHREKLLHVGMQVVHERGFGGASVRDIVQAAGVPQGSFTNHFTSKEAFGLEVIDLYFANACELMRRTLRNDDLPPLQRLRAFIDDGNDMVDEAGVKNGCLFGNFTAEANDCGEAIRQRIVESFAEVQASLAYCLRAAVKAGEIAPSTDCDELAAFILASVQGARLLAKAQRNPQPVERFKHVLFESVLR